MLIGLCLVSFALIYGMIGGFIAGRKGLFIIDAIPYFFIWPLMIKKKEENKNG